MTALRKAPPVTGSIRVSGARWNDRSHRPQRHAKLLQFDAPRDQAFRIWVGGMLAIAAVCAAFLIHWSY